MIRESGEDINEERDFKIFMGMLLGPRDFPDFRAEIISDISKGTEGAVKNEFPTLSPIKSTGDFWDLGMFLVMSRNINKEFIKNACNNRWV